MTIDREALKAIINRQTAKITATPETARAYLIEHGFVLANGNLPPWYGGPGVEQWLTENPGAYSRALTYTEPEPDDREKKIARVMDALRSRYLATRYDHMVHWRDMAIAAIEAVEK